MTANNGKIQTFWEGWKKKRKVLANCKDKTSSSNQDLMSLSSQLQSTSKKLNPYSPKYAPINNKSKHYKYKKIKYELNLKKR